MDDRIPVAIVLGAFMAATLIAVQPDPVVARGPVMIGQGPPDWVFEVLQNDSEVYTTVNIINSTTIEVTVNARRALSANYRWAMKVDHGGRNRTLQADATRAELPRTITIELPENATDFTLYTGNATEVLVGTTSTTAPTIGFPIVQTSYGEKIIAFYDAQNDASVANSTDNVTWTVTEILAGTASPAGIGALVIDSFDNVSIFWVENQGTNSSVIWSQRNNATKTWSNAKGIWTGYGSATIWTTPKAAIDSNNVIHVCFTSTQFNSSATNDFLLYSNYSESTGWWSDGTVQNDTQTWNGTWVNTNSGDDSDGCDIEIDKDGNVWIAASGGLADLDIFTNSRSTNTTAGGFGTRKKAVTTQAFALRPAINFNKEGDNLYVCGDFSGIYFANASVDNWNLTWTVYNITLSGVTRCSIAISHDGFAYVLYNNVSDNPNTVYMANSTVANVSRPEDWLNKTVLQNFAGPITTDPVPSIRSSNWPVFNRVTDVLDYVYWNDSDNGVYFDQINIPYTPPGSVPPVAAAKDCTLPASGNAVSLPCGCTIDRKAGTWTTLTTNESSNTEMIQFNNGNYSFENIGFLGCRLGLYNPPPFYFEVK